MSMRILLDTNILIHREAIYVKHQNIGLLFNWLDRLACQKYIHPVSIEEINKHADKRVRQTFQIKLASYRILRAPASLDRKIQTLSAKADTSQNDRNDTLIVNELYADRVDFLISEDRGIARKAEFLGIGDRLFTIDAFLEKVTAENPEFIDYSVLSVRKMLFGNIDLADPFFDSFRNDYPDFNRWFNRKSEEPAYVCYEGMKIAAFLYLKVEDEREPYPDIVPAFDPKKRLKIGTMKVELNGYKLGERFLKIVFDNAISQRVDEVYVTIFPRTIEQERLIRLLEDFGFVFYGEKRNSYGAEQVYVRSMTHKFSSSDPKLSFPFVSKSVRSFIVPIYPEYHTELLPDSILRTESSSNYIEQEPHRNAIRKVYVSRSIFRELTSGDIIVFYRTGGYYKSVVTTLGIVENVYRDIQDEDHFIRLCRKRSVFSDEELREHWRYNPRNRPFIVEFLYAYSFPKRPNLAMLIKNHVIHSIQSAPRGFEQITQNQLSTILALSESDPGLIVD